VTEDHHPVFRAYASRKQALVVIAALAPMIVLAAWVLVINSHFPPAVRLVFGLMILVFALILVGPIRGLLMSGPMLQVSSDGFRWRAWSDATIPWDGVEKWAVKGLLGTRYVTVWLLEPAQYPATTAARWTQRYNGWLGHGHISIPGGGMNRPPEDTEAAFRAFAPKAPLPADPRLARRLARARDRRR
jgi:hypothetical protein